MNDDNFHDPWNRLKDGDEFHHEDHEDRFVKLPETPQSHDKPSAKGLAPIILILVGVAVVGSAIGWFGYSMLNAWLNLP